jgi:hypothetical protein
MERALVSHPSPYFMLVLDLTLVGIIITIAIRCSSQSCLGSSRLHLAIMLHRYYFQLVVMSWFW